MNPAMAPRALPARGRLMALDPASGAWETLRAEDLARLLEPGDLLVVNDAATLPASLRARGEGGDPVEIRLAGPGDGVTFPAALLGAGDWRTPTEDRPPPPRLGVGARLLLDGLTATITSVDPRTERLVTLRLDASGASVKGALSTRSASAGPSDEAARAAALAALYRLGRPVQYSYLRDDLPLGAAQTAYAGRPWAVEMPSAGYSLRWSVLAALRARGVAIATLTHAAGLSSTGDPALDALLPLPERYDIPRETAAAIARTRAAGGRVIAAGTSVVRALESSARAHGRPVAGEGVARLVLHLGDPIATVDGLLTGMHQRGESSHFELLEAFAAPDLLDAATAAAAAEGYLAHEFGDACLILPGVLGARPLTHSAA